MPEVAALAAGMLVIVVSLIDRFGVVASVVGMIEAVALAADLFVAAWYIEYYSASPHI